MRDSTIFYRSFYEALTELPLINQGEVYNAIFEYCFNDNLLELKGLSKTIFTLIKPQLDANNKRFENGKKGGKPKPNDNQTVTKPEPKANQNVTKSKPNNNVNVNNNENVNENVNAGVNTLPPARDVFHSFAKGLNIDYEKLKETIDEKYSTWIKNGWKDGNGKEIIDWEQKFKNTLPYLRPMPTKQVQTTVVKAKFGKK
jgi:hypothetical protein